METLIFIIIGAWLLLSLLKGNGANHKPSPRQPVDKPRTIATQEPAQPRQESESKSPQHTQSFRCQTPKKVPTAQTKQQTKSPSSPTVAPILDPLAQMGLDYEQMIGKQLLAQGYFVIHSGLIDGWADGGVDLIAIDRQRREIHLVQCKNWQKRPLTLERLEELYQKLCRYPLDLSRFTQSQLFSTELAQVGEDTLPWLAEVQRTLPGWHQRKTLSISSEKIVDLTIGQHLYMHGPHIFRYKDLKMVTHFPELQ